MEHVINIIGEFESMPFNNILKGQFIPELIVLKQPGRAKLANPISTQPIKTGRSWMEGWSNPLRV